MNNMVQDLKFRVSRLERGNIFRKSGFWGDFAIPIGILGFMFLTASNHENRA
jgi:hypothetical protein